MRLKSPLVDLALPLTFASAVASVDVDVTPRAGAAAGSIAWVAVVGGGGFVVTLTLGGGIDGAIYDVVLTAQLVGGGAEDERFEVAVLAPGWTMPDGADGMIDLHEFVEGYGVAETLTATDATGRGMIDRDYLVKALIDAQAEVEANVSMRYRLPIAPVPSILKTAVADLAKARLYPRGAPQEIADAAKVQRRILERIAEGKLAVPGAAGSVEPEPSGAGVIGGSGSRAYPDDLADY